VPILGEETSLFPGTLLDGANGQPSDRRWWVIYTKARQEKALARDLFSREIPFYLPLVKKTSANRAYGMTSRIPLFAGYVFMYGTEDERVQSLTTNRISRILTVHDPERLRNDLRQLRRTIAEEAPLRIEKRLAPGKRVRVRQGPLKGLEGIVVTRRGRTLLVVTVDFLQQGASMEISDFMLEPVD